ncbi:hypothetical protein QTI66_01185 [Variovorax sp. J22R133]|uniref:hypothetical protein n=1 Tax=Variovorax brevis TaxID=3053503 RepID=UPI002575C774|nr:hypothetical protein [Variovorax sp. J22R133]MDM0110738.1 hypothetical protein [Variovorax sp. J22R133]
MQVAKGSSIARSLALSCTVLLITGCSFSPGISFSDPQPTLKRIVGTQPGNATDRPPPGALQEVTPELIQRQRAVQASDVTADVKHLFGTPGPYRVGSGDILNIVVWDHPDLAMQRARKLCHPGEFLAARLALASGRY